MADAAAREVITIDDEEPAREQSADKSTGGSVVKIEPESSPPPEVLEQREAEPVPLVPLSHAELEQKITEYEQKVIQLEQNYLRACKAARQAEMRAEFAEELVETKRGVLDANSKDKLTVQDLEKKVEEVEAQLAKSRERAENAFKAKVDLSRENDRLKDELADLKSGKENARKLSKENDSLRGDVKEYKRQVESWRRKEDEAYQEVRSYKKKLEEARRQAEEMDKRASDLSRENRKLKDDMDEMARKVKKSDSQIEDLSREKAKLKDDMDEMTKKTEKSDSKIEDLSRENAKLKEKMAEAARKADIPIGRNGYPTRENAELKEELDKMTSDITKLRQDFFEQEWALKAQLQQEQEKAKKEQERNLAKIEELKQKLAQIEVPAAPAVQPTQQAAQNQQYDTEAADNPAHKKMRFALAASDRETQPLVQQQLQLESAQVQPQPHSCVQQAAAVPLQNPAHPADPSAARIASPARPLDVVGHPINIFQLCCPKSLTSMAVDRALWWAINLLNDEGRRRIAASPVTNEEEEFLDCEACMELLSKAQVLDHFISPGHIEKVRARGAAVSLPAVLHWMAKLEKPRAAPAAAAAGRKQ